MPGPTRHTTDIPTYRASARCRRCENAKPSHDCGLATVQPAEPVAQDPPRAIDERRSGRTASTTTGRQTPDAARDARPRSSGALAPLHTTRPLHELRAYT